MEILDANEYGFGSREWLLVEAIKHAPVENKDLALRTVIGYLFHNPAPDLHTTLDILAQMVLTGDYSPTMHFRTVQVPTAEPEDEDEPTAEPEAAISEEEIEKFLRDSDFLLGPDAEDPFDGEKVV
jgi:hypothetical protein